MSNKFFRPLPSTPVSELGQKFDARGNSKRKLSPHEEADLMHEVIGLSPFFEKFAINTVALVEKQVADLKKRVTYLEPSTREKLTDRYGKGHEWRGLADEHLLAVYACMMRLEMRVEWG